MQLADYTNGFNELTNDHKTNLQFWNRIKRALVVAFQTWGLKAGFVLRLSMVERKIMKAVLKYGQTDFAGKEFGYDGEEDGHDEEDVRRADLSRRREFVGSTADLVHVKADRENQRRQTKQHLRREKKNLTNL